MNIRKLLLGIATVIFALTGQAQDASTQTAAKMKAFAGDVTVKSPDGSSVAATVGMTLPQGAEIVTGANGQATVELHDGIVAILGQNSTADLEKLSIDSKGVRTGLVSLKSGTVASSLDPKRKSVNNYAVKTPKGVAAARGTTYSVSYNGVTYSCTVVAGVVSNMSAATFTQSEMISTSYVPGPEIVSQLPDGGSITEQLPGTYVETTKTESFANPIPISTVLQNGSVEALTSPAGDAVITQTVTSADVSKGLALLAAAVASVSNNVADVTAVIQTIASSAGNSQAATNAVASATAAAAATASTNSNLNGGTTGTASTAAATSVAQAIVQAAVTGSVAAGNNNAATTIVATTTAAVAASTNTTNAAATSAVSNLAAALTTSANSVSGSTTVNAAQVTTAAQQVTSNPTTAVGSATQTTTTVTTTPDTPTTPSAPVTPTTTETPTVTTPQPIDPSTVSRSG